MLAPVSTSGILKTTKLQSANIAFDSIIRTWCWVTLAAVQAQMFKTRVSIQAALCVEPSFITTFMPDMCRAAPFKPVPYWLHSDSEMWRSWLFSPAWQTVTAKLLTFGN